MKKFIPVICCSFFLALILFEFSISLPSCGGKLPLLTENQQDEAVAFGCFALQAGGCFDDASIQAAFPGIDAGTCAERLDMLIDLVQGLTKIENVNSALLVLSRIDLKDVDYAKFSGLKNVDCKAAEQAMGLQ
jgi:hypothetical protein